MQALDPDQTHISRDLVTRLQMDDIAGHDVFGGDFDFTPGPLDDGGKRKHISDCFKRAFGPAFLHKTDDGVDHHHRQNDRRVDPVRQGRRDEGRQQQDINQHIVELGQKPDQRPTPTRRIKPVGTILRQTFGCLVCIKALRVCLEIFKGLIGG